MSKRSFRTALALVLGSVVVVAVLAGWVTHRALGYPTAHHAGTGQLVEVDVKAGMTFPQVARLLAARGVIAKPTWFRLYAMWEGDTTNVKPGHYVMKDDLTPAQVLKILIAGVKEKTARVTLPEGKNMLEMFAILDAAHVAPKNQLAALARDKDFLAEHGIAGDSVEGYLFPDTYQFRLHEKPRVVLERLITRQRTVWNDVLAKHGRAAAKLKAKLHWTDRDILILASIVEKEAVDPAERSRIAQVFINRLTFASFKPRYLATDPTIRYGCEVPLEKSAACRAWDPKGRLHTAQLRDRDNPYNTYVHAGLPPGPICNPGRATLVATLQPDGSDYLYFVARNARNHVFARTRAEQDRNVAKYQK